MEVKTSPNSLTTEMTDLKEYADLRHLFEQILRNQELRKVCEARNCLLQQKKPVSPPVPGRTKRSPRLLPLISQLTEKITGIGGLTTEERFKGSLTEPYAIATGDSSHEEKGVQRKRARLTSVKNVDWKTCPATRCGVIPFVIEDGQLFFCLGVDTKTGDYTDFGGQLKISDPDPVWCAVREFEEESKKVFGKIYLPEHFQDCKCLLPSWRVSHLIIFKRVSRGVKARSIRRFSQYAPSEKDEVSAIEWISEEEFRKLVFSKTSTLYTVVKDFLQSLGNYRLLIDSLAGSSKVKKPVKQRKY